MNFAGARPERMSPFCRVCNGSNGQQAFGLRLASRPIASMNHHARSIAAFAVVTMTMSASARPAYAEGFLTPFVGFNFGGDSANCLSLSSCDEKRLNWGVSFGSRHGIFGFEEDIGYAPNFFGKTAGGDNAVLTVMSNLMVVVPAGPIQPYAVAGLGLIRPHAKFDSSGLSLDQNALGYDVGGGVNVFLAHSVGIRADVRHLHTLQDITLGNLFSSQPVDFWRGTLGLALRF
jgi:opacity protein-like surface antigen